VTLRASALQWGVFDWLSAEPDDVGMRISSAFTAFASLINAKPNQRNPLSTVHDHASSTSGVRPGYVWRFGDESGATQPLLLRHYTSSTTASWTRDRSQLELGYEGDYLNDGSNNGYGSFSTTLQRIMVGMPYYGPAGGNGEHSGFLLVQWDSTDGQEFFSYTIGVRGSGAQGADYGFGNHTLLLFYSPHSSNWNVLYYISPIYGGAGFADWAFLSIDGQCINSFLSPEPPRNGQQLVRGCGLLAPRKTSGSFSYNSVQPPILLPACFWVGANAHDSPRRLARVVSPGGGGTFYQLGAGQSSSYTFDLWYLHPGGTPSIMPGWSSVGSLPWQTVSDRLSFCPLAPLKPLMIGGSTSNDFVSDWPNVLTGGAAVAQHPFFSRQAGGSGGSGGGSGRPDTGVLWPRRS
jgi:hypothetical protein